MKILITGGLGFIGIALSERLVSAGHEVNVIDNLSPQVHGHLPAVVVPQGVLFARRDIRDPRSLEDVLDQADVIIHLAAETGTAQSMYEVSRYVDVNVSGTAVLLQALLRCARRPRKFVLASSRSIYGEGAYLPADGSGAATVPSARTRENLEAAQWEHLSEKGIPLRPIATPETSTPRPASVYAATKIAQEALLISASEALSLRTVVFRFQNVYGERQSLRNPYTGIISIFANRARQGKPLPVFEDGLESRDFVHVNDVCTAIDLALSANLSATQVTYNVGSGVPTTVLDVAKLIAEHYPACPGVVVTGQFRLGDIRHCFADITRIQKELGFAPEIPFNEGLLRFLSWADAQPIVPDHLDRANEELKLRGLMK